MYFKKMPSATVVILVGGPNAAQKTAFYNMFTGGNSLGDRTNIRTTINTVPTIVLVDTPNNLAHRNPYEYCWEGIFHMGHIVVNFGDWTYNEVYGTRPPSSRMPIMMTWSGDNNETINRIMDKVLEIV
jgi:hypothetical protein